MANWELAVKLSQRLTVLRPEPVLQRKLFGAKELSLGGGIRGELKKRNFMHAKSKSSSETTHVIEATIGHLR